MNDEDFQLLTAWRAGDARSGGRLLRRYLGDVRAYVARRVSIGVDDIVQATFLTVIRDTNGCRAEGSFRGYLLGVARNQVFRHFRTQRRDRLVLGADRSDAGHDPTQRVALALSARRLAPALSAIDGDLRAVLELHYWDELSTGQVAERLCIPQGTVKSRLRRARAALAERLTNNRAHAS